MRILLDECVPRPLRREFPAHDVRTIHEMGWAGKKNGELLALMAAAGFEVFPATRAAVDAPRSQIRVDDLVLGSWRKRHVTQETRWLDLQMSPSE
jgi:hypothetical protein